MSEKIIQRAARSRRTHAKARTSERKRLIVFRSNNAIYAQIMDDKTQKIICAASSIKNKLDIKSSEKVGEEIAKLAKAKKITEVTFDRNGYRYHGRIKALAESARKGGLNF